MRFSGQGNEDGDMSVLVLLPIHHQMPAMNAGRLIDIPRRDLSSLD
jgi:hypothetical protein